MKKKLLALALAWAMGLSLAACSGGQAAKPSEAPLGGTDAPTEIKVTDSDVA